MRSARRQARAAKKNKREKKSPVFAVIIIFVLLVLILLFFIKAKTRVWNGSDKASIVYPGADGNISVTILDPAASEIITLIIPSETQVDVARNYGTLRIKNVWQLGVNEKIGGRLLAETVTKNFLFPVFLWTSKDPGYESGNAMTILSFVFFPGNTNIAFGDRLRMGIFSMNTANIDRTEIDLGKSRFLDKKVLTDGEPGYVSGGEISQRLTVYFSDARIEKANVKVNITDATGTAGVSEKLGKILQVMGGKVVSVNKKSEAENIDCVVSGTNREAVKKIVDLFSCKGENLGSSFDLDIKIGKNFAGRF